MPGTVDLNNMLLFPRSRKAPADWQERILLVEGLIDATIAIW